MLGKSVLGLCETYYGMFRGGTISKEKEKDQGELRRNKHRKIPGKGVKRGWLLCKQVAGQYTCLATPCT